MRTYTKSLKRIHEDDSASSSRKRRWNFVLDEEDSIDPLEKAIRDSSAAYLARPLQDRPLAARRESSLAAPSSPTARRHSNTFSSDAMEEDVESGTPPSSPPPRVASPVIPTRKPTFAFLKRKQSQTNEKTKNGVPLSEVNSNRGRSSLPPKKQQQYTQMQIDLGGDVRRKCAGCGMEYNSSNTEDAAMHRKFHDMNLGGIDLGKAFVKANTTRWVYEASRSEGYLVIIDRKSTLTSKTQAKKVLDVVNMELSSPAIDEATLWSQVTCPEAVRLRRAKEKAKRIANGIPPGPEEEELDLLDDSGEHDRFKVILHMKDSKCVGLCLAERIFEALPVDTSTIPTNRSDTSWAFNTAITMREPSIPKPAIVGISRIWTSGALQRSGVAMDMLDCVVNNFIYGLEIEKGLIAFSQPSGLGRLLARKFFEEEEAGWCVYNDGA